jgi:hypothetical protein
MEVVPECQSPVFVHVEVDGTGPSAPVEVFCRRRARRPPRGGSRRSSPRA